MNQQTNQGTVVPKTNRNYKDTLFRMIFKDKEKLLNLFNAVNHTQYGDAKDLEIKTLQNAIYMSLKNDLSFLIDCELHLYEHQSSLNPNIPIRDLFYIAHSLQRTLRNKSLHSSKLQKIPNPRFFLFYNGLSEQPEQKILRLSDAYHKPVEDPDLELKVTMLNINKGKNLELMEQCKDLKDYATYIAKVREYASMYDIGTAVEYAIQDCIQNGILADFLIKNRSEAIAMSIFEYDEEKEMKLIRADEREEGREEGKLYNKIEILKKIYLQSTSGEISNLLDLSEEVVKEIIAVLTTSPQVEMQELIDIISGEN